MKALLNFFVDLCLLRAAPQDLPASGVILAGTFLLNILVSLLMIVDARHGPGLALIESLFETFLMLTVLYLALRTRRLRGRFQQSATALMGSGLLLGLLALPLVAWSHRSESTEAGLLLIIWSIVVLGHIIRHTFGLTLNIGVALGVLYTMLAWSMVARLFPVT
ncbi:MAG: hypothetical protein DIZ78_10795 [endosymbiont of Escarpia spicata]|uniref:Uncharacterized protein n=1 Tax=endosymbiont of Escarpia spicata TaxID=2200908 RepID=A0A370DMQ9_9GAMM|nr:MAG: hypothetical protein DIZ78_10795 [endosymbiont of Escarpia spicata]